MIYSDLPPSTVVKMLAQCFQILDHFLPTHPHIQQQLL